eukprot:IDg6018t1
MRSAECCSAGENRSRHRKKMPVLVEIFKRLQQQALVFERLVFIETGAVRAQVLMKIFERTAFGSDLHVISAAFKLEEF